MCNAVLLDSLDIATSILLGLVITSMLSAFIPESDAAVPTQVLLQFRMLCLIPDSHLLHLPHIII